MFRTERIMAAVLGGIAVSVVAGCQGKPAAESHQVVNPPAATTPTTAAPSASPPPVVKDTKPSPVAQAQAPDGFVRVVNTHCPVQTDHAIRRGIVAQEYAVEHRGRMIGMCCGDCVDYWKNLSDDEREELVAKVMPPSPK